MATKVERVSGITDLDDFTTDDLAEGLTNLYLTNERVDDRVADFLVAGTGISLVEDDPGNTLTISSTVSAEATTVSDTATLNLTLTGSDISGAVLDSPLLQGQNGAHYLARANHTGTQAASTISDFSTSVTALLTDANIPNDLTLDNITQVTTRDHGSLQNLGDDDHSQYHTDARALTWLGTRSTTDLPEGSNLYFTDERAQDAVGTIFTDSTSIDFTYTDATPAITASVPLYFRQAASPPSPLPWRFIIDEATTNRLTNPRFATDTTDWAEYEPTGGTTLTRGTSGTLIGAGRGEVVVNTAGSGGIGVQTGTYAVSVGVPETASVWIKGAAGGESVQLQLVGDNSGATSGSSFGFTLTTEWRKLRVTKTPGASDTTFRLRVVTTAATTPTFYIGAAQLETKSVATSYADSTLGEGYAAGREAGLNHIGTIASGSGAPFQIASDGAIVASNEMVFRGERALPVSLQGDTSHFRFQGAVFSQTATWGDETGVVKIRNEVNGNGLYIDADLTTTEFGQVISCGGLTTGAALALAIPSDLSSFTGDFFQFPSKSGLILGRLTKNDFVWGSAADVLQKRVVLRGGGKFSSSTTAMTGTISSSGVNVTGTLTNFDPEFAVGDLIVAAGQTRRVATRTNDTTLTTNTAFSPSITAGTAIARANDQYLPAMYAAERSSSDLTDGTADHSFADTAAPFSGLFVGKHGRWLTQRGTSNNTVPVPTADSDGQSLTQTIIHSNAQVAVATTDETAILTGTVPGRIMGTSGTLECEIDGQILRNGTDTVVIRVKLGATTLITTGSLTTTNSVTRQPFKLKVRLGNSATNAQKATLEFWTTTTIATPYPANHVLAYGTAAEDTTADLTFQVTVDWSATDANSSFEKELGTVKVVGQ